MGLKAGWSRPSPSTGLVFNGECGMYRAIHWLILYMT